MVNCSTRNILVIIYIYIYIYVLYTKRHISYIMHHIIHIRDNTVYSSYHESHVIHYIPYLQNHCRLYTTYYVLQYTIIHRLCIIDSDSYIIYPITKDDSKESFDGSVMASDGIQARIPMLYSPSHSQGILQKEVYPTLWWLLACYK